MLTKEEKEKINGYVSGFMMFCIGSTRQIYGQQIDSYLKFIDEKKEEVEIDNLFKDEYVKEFLKIEPKSKIHLFRDYLGTKGVIKVNNPQLELTPEIARNIVKYYLDEYESKRDGVYAELAATVAMICECGCSADELVGIEMEDVNFLFDDAMKVNGAVIYLKHSKKYIRLTKTAANIVEKWIEYRNERLWTKEDQEQIRTLFITISMKKPWYRGAVWMEINKHKYNGIAFKPLEFRRLNAFLLNKYTGSETADAIRQCKDRKDITILKKGSDVMDKYLWEVDM